MRKYLFGVLLSIFGVLAAIYFFVGVPKVYETNPLSYSTPHVYGNPARSLQRVHVVVWYIVPQDNKESQIENWVDVAARNLEKLQAFHENQFQGRSQVTYEISPEPVQSSPQKILEGTAVLGALRQELRDKGFALGNDAPDEYRVFLVLYEGDEKATGSEKDFVLISRVLLTDESYQPFHATFLAHEFYHTLGIPDRYEEAVKEFSDGQQTQVGILSSGDLMGRVRVPLEQTYLARETLQNLGLY